MPEIEILDFERDERVFNKGYKIGNCDVKIIHNPDKWEIFRNVAIFSKEDKKWISFPNTKKGDKWLPVYERNPRLPKEVFSSIVTALEKDYL